MSSLFLQALEREHAQLAEGIALESVRVRIPFLTKTIQFFSNVAKFMARFSVLSNISDAPIDLRYITYVMNNVAYSDMANVRMDVPDALECPIIDVPDYLNIIINNLEPLETGVLPYLKNLLGKYANNPGELTSLFADTRNRPVVDTDMIKATYSKLENPARTSSVSRTYGAVIRSNQSYMTLQAELNKCYTKLAYTPKGRERIPLLIKETEVLGKYIKVLSDKLSKLTEEQMPSKKIIQDLADYVLMAATAAETYSTMRQVYGRYHAMCTETNKAILAIHSK